MVNILDWDKIGKFIAELRKEKGLTQYQLSELIYTARENVSKWERGVNNPTTETIVKLSEIFDVSVNEILAGERKTNDNENDIDNIVVDVLKDDAVRKKKILIIFTIAFVAILLIFLAYYFFSSYNTLYVYNIYGENENFMTTDGIVIFSKNKSYLKLGEIVDKNNLGIDKIELLYKNTKNKDIKIYETTDDNYVLTSRYGYNQLFSYEKRNSIIKNSYLKIFHDGEAELIKLTFARDMYNSFLFFNKERDEVDNNKFEVKADDLTKAEKYFKENFQYDEDLKIYTYSKDDIKITYSSSTKTLTIFSNDYNLKYGFKNNYLTYLTNDAQNSKVNFVYNVKANKCLEGDCLTDKINFFLENYYNKYVN